MIVAKLKNGPAAGAQIPLPRAVPIVHVPGFNEEYDPMWKGIVLVQPDPSECPRASNYDGDGNHAYVTHVYELDSDGDYTYTHTDVKERAMPPYAVAVMK